MPYTPYNFMTFLQAKQALAQRLTSASTSTFWPAVECGRYIIEALRTWNAAAQFYKDRFTFNATISAQPFYDLGTQANTLLTRTVTDRELVNNLQDSLMEPVNDWASSTTWAGSEQFAMADLVDALERRRNQFLLVTGAVQAYSQPTPPPPSMETVALTDTTIDVRRLAWQNSIDNRILGLTLEDEDSLNRYIPRKETTRDLPSQYTLVSSPPLILRLVPPPSLPGTLHMLSVQAGASLNVSSGVAVGVPQDFAWVLKWGALEDALGKDSEASDPLRAQYCGKRFEEGLQLARLAAGPVQVQINGVSILTMTLEDFDQYDPRWQSTSTALPTAVATAGMNMLILNRIPTTAHGITVDCVRNFPVPVADTDKIAVGREHLDVILDYAVHLAMFKCGGEEFLATIPHYERLMKLAADHNSRLKANASMFPILQRKQAKERKRRPSREIDVMGDEDAA